MNASLSLLVTRLRNIILNTLENELVHERAVKISAYEQNLKDECEEKARNYISLAIAKYCG